VLNGYKLNMIACSQISLQTNIFFETVFIQDLQENSKKIN